MIKGKLLWLSMLVLAPLMLIGQNPCGTMPYKDPWLTEFQQSLDKLTFRTADDSVLYVPITLHILGDDNGGGYYSVGRVMRAFCVLNEDFLQANIQFYLNGDLRYIDRSDWYDHESIQQGAEMMFANNVPGSINCYVVQNPAGNCGYNLPYAGIALNKSCMQPSDHTWAHEVGHNLSLPHPFLGWEGGQTHDQSTPPVFNKPAPRYVTYDYSLFKKKYYPDTLIIDTALVELVDGSNCRDASDGFCDTKPDYLASRWACGQDSNRLTRQLDPDSTSFYSNGKWIMSYSLDNCNAGFSDEQIAAMRANLRQEKPDHLLDQSPPVVISEPVELTYPDDGEIYVGDEITLEWSQVEGATHYLVEVSRISSFGFLEIESIVDTNVLTINTLAPGKKYYWRVKAFNRHAFCEDYSGRSSFTLETMVSHNKDLTRDKVETRLTASNIILSFSSGLDQRVSYTGLYSIDGRNLEEVISSGPKSKNSEIYLNRPQTPGAYFVVLSNEQEFLTIKMIID